MTIRSSCILSKNEYYEKNAPFSFDMQKKISPFPWSLLRDWHSANGRHELPWRQYFHLSEKDLGYHVWLSEILLQQTQVSRGIAYYERILARYPTIESLAQSSYEEFFEYYQ